MFPEQGPIWNWIKENIHELSNLVGANYNKSGSGALRKIPEESIKELQAIFKETGGLEFFDIIKKKSEELAKQLNITFTKDDKDDYFKFVYEGSE